MNSKGVRLLERRQRRTGFRMNLFRRLPPEYGIDGSNNLRQRPLSQMGTSRMTRTGAIRLLVVQSLGIGVCIATVLCLTGCKEKTARTTAQFHPAMSAVATEGRSGGPSISTVDDPPEDVEINRMALLESLYGAESHEAAQINEAVHAFNRFRDFNVEIRHIMKKSWDDPLVTGNDVATVLALRRIRACSQDVEILQRSFAIICDTQEPGQAGPLIVAVIDEVRSDDSCKNSRIAGASEKWTWTRIASVLPPAAYPDTPARKKAKESLDSELQRLCDDENLDLELRDLCAEARRRVSQSYFPEEAAEGVLRVLFQRYYSPNSDSYMDMEK